MSWKLKDKVKRRLAKEKGAIYKSPGDRIKVALIYPNRYSIGMANLGFQAVYSLLNDLPYVVCERAFLPDPEDLIEYKRQKAALFSYESQRPLYDFDLLAFSVPYEGDYPNLLEILDLSQIPLLREERAGRYPLIGVGGVTAFMNPEPLADFIDIFFIGEAEEIIGPFFATLKEAKDKEYNRSCFLAEVCRLPGIYVPEMYEPKYDPFEAQDKGQGRLVDFRPRGLAPAKVVRAWVNDLDKVSACSRIFTEETELGPMHLIEVGRGCARGCRFCAAGFVYRPPRFVNLERLKSLASSVLKEGETIGLLGTAISDHPDLVELSSYIMAQGGRVSYSSMRFDSLSEDKLAAIKRAGQKTITLAPEAGSERLRRVINKGINEKGIISALHLLAEGLALSPDRVGTEGTGENSLKLYFMVGLPTETEEDIYEIIRLARRIKEESAIKKITVSLSPFVPKPGTPFQWHPMETVKRLSDKVGLVKKGLQKEKGITVSLESPKASIIQGILSLGDRRLSRVLMSFHQEKDWGKVLNERDAGLFRREPFSPDPVGIQGEPHRQKERDELLPWDFIDHGFTKDYLWEEYQKGLKGKLSRYCGLPGCALCGLC